ncbi:MAG: hypothetical protein JSV88_10810, partial [Candidatus Aminicenantes bacterium]
MVISYQTQVILSMDFFKKNQMERIIPYSLVVRSKNNVSLSVRAEREEQGVMTRHSGAMSRKN